jgi:hypothetical protein
MVYPFLTISDSENNVDLQQIEKKREREWMKNVQTFEIVRVLYDFELPWVKLKD